MEEFGAAARHLPIVFVPGANQMTPAFLLGTQPGHNSFVAQDGTWTGGYLPAYVRRYPFIIGEVEGAEPLVCIDESSDRLSRDTGQSLFEEDGTDTPLLAERIKLTTDYFASAKRTDALCIALRDLDLLRPITIDVKGKSQQGSVMHGLFAVDEPKLAALPDESFLELRRQGFIGPIYAHLISLAAVDKLSVPTPESEPA